MTFRSVQLLKQKPRITDVSPNELSPICTWPGISSNFFEKETTVRSFFSVSSVRPSTRQNRVASSSFKFNTPLAPTSLVRRSSSSAATAQPRLRPSSPRTERQRRAHLEAMSIQILFCRRKCAESIEMIYSLVNWSPDQLSWKRRIAAQLNKFHLPAGRRRHRYHYRQGPSIPNCLSVLQ